MVKAFAEQVQNHLIETFPDTKPYSLSDLLGPSIPKPIAHFLKRALHQKVHEIDLEVYPDWIDYESEEVQQKTEDWRRYLQKHARVPASLWEQTLRQAVRQVISFLIQPSLTLTKFVFGTEYGVSDLKRAKERMSFFNSYPEFTRAVDDYILRTGSEKIARQEFSDLLAEVDRRVADSLADQAWINKLESLYNIVESVPSMENAVPADVLLLLFDQKGRHDLARLVENDQNEGYTRAELLQLLRSDGHSESRRIDLPSPRETEESEAEESGSTADSPNMNLIKGLGITAASEGLIHGIGEEDENLEQEKEIEEISPAAAEIAALEAEASKVVESPIQRRDIVESDIDAVAEEAERLGRRAPMPEDLPGPSKEVVEKEVEPREESKNEAVDGPFSTRQDNDDRDILRPFELVKGAPEISESPESDIEKADQQIGSEARGEDEGDVEDDLAIEDVEIENIDELHDSTPEENREDEEDKVVLKDIRDDEPTGEFVGEDDPPLQKTTFGFQQPFAREEQDEEDRVEEITDEDAGNEEPDDTNHVQEVTFPHPVIPAIPVKNAPFVDSPEMEEEAGQGHEIADIDKPVELLNEVFESSTEDRDIDDKDEDDLNTNQDSDQAKPNEEDFPTIAEAAADPNSIPLWRKFQAEPEGDSEEDEDTNTDHGVPEIKQDSLESERVELSQQDQEPDLETQEPEQHFSNADNSENLSQWAPPNRDLEGRIHDLSEPRRGSRDLPEWPDENDISRAPLKPADTEPIDKASFDSDALDSEENLNPRDVAEPTASQEEIESGVANLDSDSTDIISGQSTNESELAQDEVERDFLQGDYPSKENLDLSVNDSLAMGQEMSSLHETLSEEINEMGTLDNPEERVLGVIHASRRAWYIYHLFDGEEASFRNFISDLDESSDKEHRLEVIDRMVIANNSLGKYSAPVIAIRENIFRQE